MIGEQITVLAIDDDYGDAELLRRSLEQIAGLHVDFVHVADPAETAATLARVAVDVTFLDYRLGDQTGMEVLQAIRASGDLRPIICLTGQGDEYIASRLVRAGADDYLVKADATPELLRRAIENSTAQFERRKLEEHNKQLLQELKVKNEILEKNNRRLGELYETAHQFVDNVSHEFRTPLTVIKEFNSILRDGLAGEMNDQQREYLDIALNRVDDLSTMIEDMLDISKLNAGLLGVSRRTCRVPPIIEHIRPVIERKALANKVVLDISMNGDLPAVYCDPEKIGRVIINLAVNAIKFSTEQSNVRLWTQHEPHDAQVVIGVTDHGPGIDPEHVAALFERFKQGEATVRAGPKGFGLGLHIARELVYLNLGDLEVESELGQGSTFRFSIPTAEPSKLMARYLNRVEALRDGLSVVSVISARVTHDVNDALLEELEQFILHHLRRTDLAFRAEPHAWLLVIAGTQRETGGLARQLEEALSAANRNRQGEPLPPIEFESRGTWRLDKEKAELLRQMEVHFTPLELCHV